MYTLEVIKTRRSTRKFKQEQLPREIVEEIVEAGRYAPSGGNSQTTHFLVIQNKEVLEKLATLAREAFAQMEVTADTYRSMANSINASKKGSYVFHYNAPTLILTANQKDYGNNMADCVCALENMMIAANALAIGSCYINQLNWLNEDPAILAYLMTLGLGENERVYASLAIGYADTEDGKPVRTALERHGNEVTFLE